MNRLSQILKEQFEIHKGLKVQDVYKLLYQGTFCCEHAVDEKSREILYEEYDKAEPREDERLVELVSPHLFIYRINIRPCKAHSIEKERLFEWFYESSRIEVGTIQQFFTSWNRFKLVNEQKNYFPADEIERFEEVLKIGVPVLHHSMLYKETNNPSYRVINGSVVSVKKSENKKLQIT